MADNNDEALGKGIGCLLCLTALWYGIKWLFNVVTNFVSNNSSPIILGVCIVVGIIVLFKFISVKKVGGRFLAQVRSQLKSLEDIVNTHKDILGSDEDWNKKISKYENELSILVKKGK